MLYCNQNPDTSASIISSQTGQPGLAKRRQLYGLSDLCCTACSYSGSYVCFPEKTALGRALISAALALAAYLIALAPVSIAEILADSEWRSLLLLAMLIHLGIAITLTAAAYLAAHLIRKARKQTSSPLPDKRSAQSGQS